MSDWSSDVCSSDLVWGAQARPAAAAAPKRLLFPAPVPLVQHALGPVQRISLSVVAAPPAQQLDDARAGPPFGHHLAAALVDALGDAVDDRSAHRVVNRKSRGSGKRVSLRFEPVGRCFNTKK